MAEVADKYDDRIGGGVVPDRSSATTRRTPTGLLALQADADTVVVFNLSSTQSCKLLWKSCIEHHTFFRLIAPPAQPSKSLFSLGSRYRYR